MTSEEIDAVLEKIKTQAFNVFYVVLFLFSIACCFSYFIIYKRRIERK
jgi:hypothetical protein